MTKENMLACADFRSAAYLFDRALPQGEHHPGSYVGNLFGDIMKVRDDVYCSELLFDKLEMIEKMGGPMLDGLLPTPAQSLREFLKMSEEEATEVFGEHKDDFEVYNLTVGSDEYHVVNGFRGDPDTRGIQVPMVTPTAAFRQRHPQHPMAKRGKYEKKLELVMSPQEFHQPRQRTIDAIKLMLMFSTMDFLEAAGKNFFGDCSTLRYRRIWRKVKYDV